MQFRVVPLTEDFLVLDAAATTVERTHILLSRIRWLVLRVGEKYFVFSAREVEAALEWARPDSLLTAALHLNRVAPSIVLRSTTARVDLEQSPASGTIPSRAVILRKRRSEDLAVSMVGTLVRDVKAPAAAATTMVGVKRAPERPAAHGRRRTVAAPARKGAAKKATKKKLAAKKAVGRIFDRPRTGAGRMRGGKDLSRDVSFGFAPIPTRTPAKAKTRGPVRSFGVIDVFYATDREPRFSGASNTIVDTRTASQ